ncbi:MAG: hypothetical protein ABH883_04705 [Candidatus Omnitrophota bacterium]
MFSEKEMTIIKALVEEESINAMDNSFGELTELMEQYLKTLDCIITKMGRSEKHSCLYMNL